MASTGCDELGFFTSTNDLKPGSDVIVIRRADTALFAGTNAAATTLEPTTSSAADRTTTDGEVYIQSNSRSADIQIATNEVEVNPLDLTTSAKTADNATPTLQKMPSKTTATWADTRKLRVHIYYLCTM